MTKITAVALSILGLVTFVIITLLFGYLGFSNTANSFEVDIKAKYNNNRNVYDNGWKKVQEVAQVPDMQVAALERVYKTAIEARYGADGSKALLQFITEQNPNLDQSTFLKIQQDIEAFRMEFASNQTELVSRKQAYERFLTATTSGRFYNSFAGYPRIDLSKFDIVTSDKTEQDFNTKRAEPLRVGK
jgi:hypothetical protein